MKRLLSIILMLIITISISACGTTDGSSTTNSKPSRPTEASLKQSIVNECCNYSNVETIKGLDIGTFDTKWVESNNWWFTTVKGTYYPADEYGNIGDKMQFDISFAGSITFDSKFSKVRY